MKILKKNGMGKSLVDTTAELVHVCEDAAGTLWEGKEPPAQVSV